MSSTDSAQQSVQIPATWIHPALIVLSFLGGGGVSTVFSPREFDEALIRTIVQTAIEAEFAKEREHRRELEEVQTKALQERLERIEGRLRDVESEKGINKSGSKR